MKTKCWFCGKKEICHWTILKRKAKHGTGAYCTKDCAVSDQWGPVYRGSRLLYVRNGVKE